MLNTVRASLREPGTETVPLAECAGRVLGRTVFADRDYPARARSVRDGYAVRAADLPGVLQIIGEVRAGTDYEGQVAPGTAVEIMTGAPVPVGSDAVVMVEHVRREGDRVHIDRPAKPGDFINPQGSEAQGGAAILEAGVRLDYAHTGVLATVGTVCVEVFRRPSVAILATGDEIVEAGETPLSYQIRNSNSHTLAAQVAAAGGIPDIFPVARDEYEHTRDGITRGLQSDLLLLSGGVSAGKYDIVEQVLADLGAEFFFDRVRIQPGQPLVFGRAGGKFFFGLPGNPVSTMVTFELFARAALDLLSGVREIRLPLLTACLTSPFRHKTGLTRFLPARLSSATAEVSPVPWQGSSDVMSVARANAFLVARDDREAWGQGEAIEVLAR